MINVCVPVLKRYDLLQDMLRSLEAGSRRPDKVYVIDNGQNGVPAVRTSFPVIVLQPEIPLGVAESWNWFIRNVPADRLITNDDIVFGPDSLQAMVNRPEVFVSCGFGFACFLLRDECVQRVGLFDESISPGYAYFEDRDYFNRMKAEKIVDYVVECGVEHKHSQTLASFSPEEQQQHHKKFVLAQTNFLKKWGELPPDLEVQKA